MRSVLILTLLLFPSFSLAFTIPPNDGFVTDAVGILNAQEETTLEESIRMYRDETSNEIAILIVGSLEGESIADRAVEIGREWGVGGAENDN